MKEVRKKITPEKKNYWKKIPILEKLFQKVLFSNRRKILKIFDTVITVKKKDLVLDVGTSPLDIKSENIFLKKFKKHKKLTCLSNQDLKLIKKKFINFSYVIGDARKMKFKDNSFDVVHSNATIEHVGTNQMQLKFISECLRVSRQFVFITTPNKYFPVDFHTKIPFLHWLLHSIFNFILKLLGDNFFRHKTNLNLISFKKISAYCKKLKITNYKIIFHYFLFFKSNIILIIQK
jgi:ubiquinone/menaquinone biosynthesis C-methylase UbiE